MIMGVQSYTFERNHILFLIIAAIVVATFVASIYPAWFALRTRPADALRVV